MPKLQNESQLNAAIGQLTNAAQAVRATAAEKGWSAAETHKSALELEQAALLWRIRRTQLLELKRPDELLAIEAELVKLENA